MKRIYLALLFSLWSVTAAWATCSSPISGKDGTGATINLGAVVDGSSNCWGGTAIVDGTAAANKGTVKAASTAPVSTDTTVVVGFNPNNAANTVPWLMNLTQWAGGTLGSPSNYGTSPGAVAVPGVNAFITNTPAITGTVTANAGTNLNTSLLALETGGNLATTATNTGTIAGAITASVVQSNTKQVNGITTLAGAGATGTGSQRVTAAQDTTTIAGSAPGTAGSASANVLTVQGIASMTPFLVNPGTAANWGIVAQASTTSGQVGQLMLGAVTTAAPTYTTGQTDPMSLDLAGNVRVNCTTGCSASSSITGWGGGTLGAMANYGTSPGAVLVPGVNAFVTNTNANGQTTMSASSPVTIASDQSAVATKAASGAFASGSIASGALASGSIASGAAVSGAFAAGAITDLAHGQGAMAASVPVAIASNQSSIPVAATLGAGSALAGGVEVYDAAGTNKLNVVAASTAPVTATNTAVVVDLRPDSPGLITTGGATTANSVPVIPNSQYPANSVTTTPTPAAAKSTGTTGAVTATITAVASATNYLCGFDVSAIGGTAAIGPVTVTGLLGGTWTYQLTSTAGGVTLSKEFNMCVPASAVNTAISVVTTADGTATAVDVQLHGYTQ